MDLYRYEKFVKGCGMSGQNGRNNNKKDDNN